MLKFSCKTCFKISSEMYNKHQQTTHEFSAYILHFFMANSFDVTHALSKALAGGMQRNSTPSASERQLRKDKTLSLIKGLTRVTGQRPRRSQHPSHLLPRLPKRSRNVPIDPDHCMTRTCSASFWGVRCTVRSWHILDLES